MPAIGALLTTHARRIPDREALVFGGLRLTYAELDAEVDRRARALKGLGLGHGDRCAIFGPNSADWVVGMLAALKLGAIVVPINPHSPVPELAHCLRNSGTSMLLADEALASVARNGVATTGAGTPLLLLGGGGDDLPGLADRAATDSGGPVEVDVQESDDAFIIHTSGTTGAAKGVLLDHHRALWVGIDLPIGICGMRDGARLLHVAPLYHSAQLTMMLIPGLLVGATHVVASAFDPAQTLDTMERERITAFFGVPTMYGFLLRQPDFASRDLSALQFGLFGGAPMPGAVSSGLAAAIPHVRLYAAYGQTEAGPGGICSFPDETVARPDATGRHALLCTEVRVVDPDGRDVEAGQAGEVVLRGETVMKGYWNDPKATAVTIRDGWLHTGDVAQVDADGYLTIVDRLKDMVITGGRNVYSVEVEQAMAAHPLVGDCAVVGRPHADFGETVVAFVTPVDGGTVTLEDLREFCSAHVADYKLPRELVIGPIPRNASGKILKRELRRRLPGTVSG